jgi:hypothetical protein
MESVNLFADGWSIPAAEPEHNGRLQLKPVSAITKRSIEWLERPLWQRCCFQLLAGPKGAGKGTYLAGLASRVSNAGGTVVFVVSEDSVAIDIRPRLEAAGADIERCHVIEEHVRLPEDIAELAHFVGIDLLVVDPLSNHIGARETNSEGAVRDAIARLNGLADQLGCLIIGVRHLSKDRSRGALASVLGSTAWVDTPRAVVVIARDDEDPDKRHIQTVAGNRSGASDAFAFRIERREVEGLSEPVTVAVELEEAGKSVDAMLTGQHVGTVSSEKIQEAILLALETGPKSREYLDAVLTDELGVSHDTVYKRGLAPMNKWKIRSRKEGLHGGWVWELL